MAISVTITEGDSDPVAVSIAEGVGPRGLTGETGADGSDASVTNANVNTAISSNTSATMAALGAVSLATEQTISGAKELSGSIYFNAGEVEFSGNSFVMDVDTAGDFRTALRALENTNAALNTSIATDPAATRKTLAKYTHAAFEGDSLTDDASAKPNGSWAQNLFAKFAAFSGADYSNFAVAGELASAMTGQYAAGAGSLTASDRMIFMLWAGTNDVAAAASTPTIANNIETLVDSAIADSMDTLVLHLPPGPASSGTVRKDSGVVNTLSTQQCYDKADHFVPVPLIVDPSTDYTDSVHLNDLGRGKVTDYVGKKLAGVYSYDAAIDPESIGSLTHYWSAMLSAENLDASDAAITVSGTEVKTVTDRASNDNLIGGSGTRPTRVDRGNGVWTWQFTGDDFIDVASEVLAQPLTIFGVVEQVDSSTSNNYRWLDDIVAGTRIGAYGAAQSSPALAGSSTVLATTKLICQRAVICLVFDGASSAIYINGSKFAEGSPGTGGFTTGIRIGGEQSGGSGLQWVGHIGAVAMYSASLTSAQIRGVSRSLCETFKVHFEPNLGT